MKMLTVPKTQKRGPFGLFYDCLLQKNLKPKERTLERHQEFLGKVSQLQKTVKPNLLSCLVMTKLYNLW